MNRLNEIRSYLAMNEEIEFSYKGLECFITPNNVIWEFWVMWNVSLKNLI